jgi:hypothetical protein
MPKFPQSLFRSSNTLWLTLADHVPNAPTIPATDTTNACMSLVVNLKIYHARSGERRFRTATIRKHQVHSRNAVPLYSLFFLQYG